MKPEEFERLAKNGMMQKLNPHLFSQPVNRPIIRPEPIPVYRGSEPEEKFLDLWECLGGPPLEREHKFLADRKFRLDFFHPSSRTGVEIDGGQWTKSAHSSGTGLARDKEKSNECTFARIHLFRLTPDMILVDNLKRIIRFVQENS